MTKLILMQGLPASGKSTKAAELLREYGNAVRINRDLLRMMLHDNRYSAYNEAVTREAAKALVEHYLYDMSANGPGVVIIDDTNLAPRTVRHWQILAQEAGAQCEIVRMETTIAECLRRDALRANRVGASVIMGMAMQYGVFVPPKGYIICDIDGTVADTTPLRHHLLTTPKNWDAWFDGIGGLPVREAIATQVRQYHDEGYTIVFVSGRGEEHRVVTEQWLKTFRLGMYAALLMRPMDDRRDDTDVKREILHRYFPDKQHIHKVLDDRPRVIRMWREEGLDIEDVGEGLEF